MTMVLLFVSLLPRPCPGLAVIFYHFTHPRFLDETEKDDHINFKLTNKDGVAL